MASTSESDKDVEKMLEKMRLFDGEDFFRTFHPMRFHAPHFLRTLKEKANHAGISDEEHKNNLLTLAILGIEEGQNVDRIKRKISPDRKQFLKKAEMDYGLVSRGLLSPTSATLSRIAGCFVKEISLGICDGTLQIDTKVKPEMIAPAFPPFMCLSSFGSLIPAFSNFRRKEIFHIVYDAWCFHQLVFDEMINRGKKKTEKYQIVHFAERTHSSRLYLAKERIEHCQIIGLLKVLDGELVIADQYQSALNEAASKWRSSK